MAMTVMGIMIAGLTGLCVWLVEQHIEQQKMLLRVLSIVRGLSRRITTTNVDTANAFRVINNSLSAMMGMESEQEEKLPPHDQMN